MSKLFLCVDPGGSQTKIIYQLTRDKKPRYLLMPPEVEQIKESNLKRYLEKESSMSNPSPIRQAYLEVKERTFVVGYFASNFPAMSLNKILRFLAIPPIYFNFLSSNSFKKDALLP